MKQIVDVGQPIEQYYADSLDSLFDILMDGLNERHMSYPTRLNLDLADCDGAPNNPGVLVPNKYGVC